MTAVVVEVMLCRFRIRSVRSEDLRCELDVRFVDEEARAAREVERIRTASVIGDKPRRDSRRYERRLGEFRFASRGVGADLDHGTTPRGGALR
jgi:hypothetical protein